MSNKHDNHGKVEEQAPINENDIDINELDDIENSDTEAAKNIAQEEEDEVESLRKQLADTQAQLEKEKKEYMFLMADFDNFRKRTLKEKSELIKNGGENAMRGLLPIIDDFERSLQAINESSDAMAIKEGVELIYNKFTKYLEQNGVKPIASEPGSDFDTEIHEAVTMFPTDNPDQKGKVIDTVQKGYTLNDKVIRHAKVVVGQ
ncbi:MAG TPA: nucleotide exchange factor GrpE [Muribaculum sp.]|jgi:molecular chaperone GrpE|uniref:Protein GrpE n=1 Tax=Heminiphilus faecis TaxID=2601703 RepID=A0ABV4CV55_9BACT|nr:nucleotide exchange factor GrpE [Heminiphilus faecis]RLT76280.1 nucleotide exchange factor GrpE [bacterium J10(2018)]HRF68600.1 nucleotide exchange factor GrpE [Muribaculum sp.]